MRISIIGLGLIGGSLGLALKKARGADIEITGFARRQEVASAALRRGAVDAAVADIAPALSGCDLAFVCTPVQAVQEVLRLASLHARPGCVVTDVASTKRCVMGWASEYLHPAGVGFVGGHPMAGREKSGVDAADAELFRGCTYCLTPAAWASAGDIDAVRQTVEWVGGRPFFLEAEEHDFLVAAISHLPLVVSAATVAATTKSEHWPRMAHLAASGYRDVTRLASGNPRVNADIFATNREALVHWIDEFSAALAVLRKRVATEGADDLEEALREACEARLRWLESLTGAKAAQP